MVYILNIDNKPLMPTNRYAKVRKLLKNKQAKVVNTNPFTIKLLYSTGDYVQPVTLGIDSGYLNIGFSAISNKKELISGEVKLLQNVSERLKVRSVYRKQRRSRLRYRKPKFNNRRRSNEWLAPSINHKLDSHIRFIDKIKKILPVSETIVEVANFDIQKIKNPEVSGTGYQEGEQLGFFNLREYILHRDNHKCQNPNCKNKDKEQILEVHHLGFWKGDRSNRPSNLITLCNKCHIPKNHLKKGFLYNWSPKLKSFKDSTFMSIVRWRLINIIGSKSTYGYVTKSKRISLGLEKTHYNDAFCIAGGEKQKRVEPIMFNQIKRNNRSLEKFYDKKIYDIRDNKVKTGQELFNGRRCRNKNLNSFNLRVYRGLTKSKGKRVIKTGRYFYQPNDLVKIENKIYTVKGTHNKGSRVIMKENNKSYKVSDLKPYKFSKGFAILNV